MSDAISRHGDRFILAVPADAGPTQADEASRPERLILVQNFFTELLERVSN